MNKSESIQELAKALANAQASMPAAKMNATNTFHHNKYADLGSIIETARATLKANGLSYSQLTIGGGEQIGVTTILMHTSGEWLESTILIPLGEVKGKSLAQEAGSIITYLRRYSLASVLGIYADEDNDGNQPEKVQSKAEQEEKKQPQSPAKSNGSRPYSPATVKDKIHDRAKQLRNFDPNDAQRQLLRHALEQCFPGDKNAEEKRHTLLFYLTGFESTTDTKLNGQLFKAILEDWLKATKDSGGEYVVDALARKEAEAIVREALKVEGQQEMSL